MQTVGGNLQLSSQRRLYTSGKWDNSDTGSNLWSKQVNYCLYAGGRVKMRNVPICHIQFLHVSVTCYMLHAHVSHYRVKAEEKMCRIINFCLSFHFHTFFG